MKLNLKYYYLEYKLLFIIIVIAIVVGIILTVWMLIEGTPEGKEFVTRFTIVNGTPMCY